MKPHPGSRGYVLIEILAILALMAVFLLAAGHLFTQCMGLQRDVTRLEAMVSDMRGLTDRLRKDLWSALDVTSDGLSLAIDSGSVAEATWRSEPADDAQGEGSWLVREENGRERRWRVPDNVSFTTLGETAIVMHVGDSSLTFLRVVGRSAKDPL